MDAASPVIRYVGGMVKIHDSFSTATSPGLKLLHTISMDTLLVLPAAAVGDGRLLACSAALHRSHGNAPVLTDTSDMVVTAPSTRPSSSSRNPSHMHNG